MVCAQPGGGGGIVGGRLEPVSFLNERGGGLVGGGLQGAAVELGFEADAVLKRRGGAGADEEFVDDALAAVAELAFAAPEGDLRGVDAGPGDAGRRLELSGLEPGVGGEHHVAPDQPGGAGGGAAGHRFVVGVADPDADGQLRGVADCPVVDPHIVLAGVAGGAGFGGGGAVEDEVAVEAVEQGAGLVVAEDVGDLVALLGAGDGALIGLLEAVDDLPAGVADFENGDGVKVAVAGRAFAEGGLSAHHAVLGDRGVGVSHIEQRDIAAAERD